jgi:hypothetical protein
MLLLGFLALLPPRSSFGLLLRLFLLSPFLVDPSEEMVQVAGFDIGEEV